MTSSCPRRAALRIPAAALLALAMLGCDSRPRAPALQDGPVYRDDREGFRFFVPEGWKQRARGQAPRGPLASERMLTEYKSTRSGYGGTLQVTVADVPESTSLSEYLAKNTLTGQEWRLATPAADFKINNAPAAKITYVTGTGREEMIREIVAFRRGERVYFFKSYYARVDTQARQALRTAVETIVW